MCTCTGCWVSRNVELATRHPSKKNDGTWLSSVRHVHQVSCCCITRVRAPRRVVHQVRPSTRAPKGASSFFLYFQFFQQTLFFSQFKGHPRAPNKKKTKKLKISLQYVHVLSSRAQFGHQQQQAKLQPPTKATTVT